jgi:hypothetical protein
MLAGHQGMPGARHAGGLRLRGVAATGGAASAAWALAMASARD